MKKILFITGLAMISISISAQNVEKEKEAIKKVIQTAYVEGLQNEGDMKKIDSGFHPDFNLLGVEGKEMWILPIKDWKKSTQKKVDAGKLPKKDKAEMVRVSFENIDVSGTAAVVKLNFMVGDTPTYIDYISLYKFEDDWKIVSKIFYKL